MSGHILRDWFLPEDGIRREVISADIQSFLGNDATVRPGSGDVDGRKARAVKSIVCQPTNASQVKGYWIRAYRNLTSKMIEDLKVKSSKWDQETRKSGKRVNYEDSRTYREQGGRYDSGKHSPHVDAPYHQTSSRHAPHPDMMDYEPTRPVARQDTHSRTHLSSSGAPVGSYGEPVVYASSRTVPPPGYVIQGDEYVQDPSYHGRPMPVEQRGSPHHIPGYQGHPVHPGHSAISGHPSRDLDPMDARYAGVREEPRYSGREDRYAHSREDLRYAASREEPRYHHEESRHRSTREEPRYSSSTSHSSHGLREDPRYASARDPREDVRYESVPRGDPRLQPPYQDPAHAARYGYPAQAATAPPGGQLPGGHGLDKHASIPSPMQQPLPGSYAQPQIFDQYGRPVAYPPHVQPVEQVYQTQSSRSEAPYSNSSRKRGAPPEDGSRHGRMR